MRTLIARAWRDQRFADVIAALDAATLVGIEPSVLITDDETLYDALVHHHLLPAELFRSNWFARADRADAFVAIQTKNYWDMSLDTRIQYAQQHGIPTAVWRV